MKNSRALPIPFLILILAGVVSLFSTLADRGARASGVKDDSLQVQTVEQERVAAIYFRVLSWLSGVSSRREVDPVNVHQQPMSHPDGVKTPHGPACAGRIELCLFRSAQNIAASKHPSHNLN